MQFNRCSSHVRSFFCSELSNSRLAARSSELGSGNVNLNIMKKYTRKQLEGLYDLIKESETPDLNGETVLYSSRNRREKAN